jgi:hypothetical protein
MDMVPSDYSSLMMGTASSNLSMMMLTAPSRFIFTDDGDCICKLLFTDNEDYLQMTFP